MSTKCLLVIVASLTLGFASDAYASKAVHASCGQTITADTTLESDLTKCSGPGIRIGADDITLDLNGHSITGKGKDVGVDNTAGYDGVTIEDGSIRNFMESVAIVGASDNHLRGLSLSDNRHVGFYVQNSSAIQIEQNSVVDIRFAGIFLWRSHDIRVERNSSSGNGAGVVADASDHLAIEGNVAEGNDGGGIELHESSESHVAGNTVSDNGGAGIFLDAADTNQVSSNIASRNVDGIGVIGNANTITDNQVADTSGCKKGCGYGISLEAGADNLIAHNDVRRTLRDGIRIDAFFPELPTFDNVVRDNVVSDATVDGLSIGTEGPGTVSGTLIERNVATDSGDDGFDIRRSAATLTANTANDNFDLGIEAVPGVVDGGGNRASRNGNPLQCTNVFCR
ncbi:MAG TPA: right-handed parallel beta-helix repeat-containing protein [Thermoleophilaceae bacterium]|nr:right-handed parallel beta-helix repeat-containing protein [Thermoleophilaceae bacterium]